MINKILVSSIVAVLILCSCDNNKINKFRGSISNNGIYNSEAVKNNVKELWKFKTDGQIHASVAFDEKSIYIGSQDQYFYSVDAENGKLNWRFKTGGEIFSTALIYRNHVYFQSFDGFLYKLKKETGKLVWKFKTEGEKKHQIKNYYNPKEFVNGFWDFYQSSPTVLDDIIYFGTGETFYAVDANNGEKMWDYKTEGAIHSSPAIENDKIVFGSYDSRVYCLNAKTGIDIWTYETGRDTAQYVWLGVEASPLIDSGKVYIGSRDAKVYCFDINTGDTIWTNDNFNRSWMPSSFAIGEKEIYSGSSDGFSFYSLNKQSGKIEYTLKTNSYTFSSPAISQNMAYIGSANGRLYGVNLEDKEIEWEYKTYGVITDTLKVYNDKGEMDIERMKTLFKSFNVNDYNSLYNFYEMSFMSTGAILSSPVANNNIIYFGSCDGYLYAISEK